MHIVLRCSFMGSSNLPELACKLMADSLVKHLTAGIPSRIGFYDWTSIDRRVRQPMLIKQVLFFTPLEHLTHIYIYLGT